MKKHQIYFIQISILLLSFIMLCYYTNFSIGYFISGYSIIITLILVPTKLLVTNIYFSTEKSLTKKITLGLLIFLILFVGIFYILIPIKNNMLFYEIFGIGIYIYMLKTYPLNINK